MDPLEVLLEHTLVCLPHLIRDDAPLQGMDELLWRLPNVSRGLRDTRRADAASPYLIFYTASNRPRPFFLDGVPRGVDLFASFSTPLSDRDAGKMRVRSAMADRAFTVDRVRAMQAGATKTLQLMVDRATQACGLPALPPPVIVAVDRARAVSAALRATRPSSIIRCAHAACNRLFAAGRAAADWPVCVGHGVEDDGSAAEYWHSLCRDGREYAQRRFCCGECAIQHAEELERLLPLSIELATDDELPRTGRGRVAKAFQVALRRNAECARAIRGSKNVVTRCVSRFEADAALQMFTTWLNVDLAVLFAASVVAECGSLSRGRLLPGSASGWRQEPLYYARAVATVTKLYTRHKRTGIISSLNAVPRYIEAVQRVAPQLF